MQKILKQAKSHQKRKEWKKAVSFYEMLFNDKSENLSDKVYTDYAKCLRIAGNTNKAETILIEGREIYFESETILRELYRLYDASQKWNNALRTSKELINLNPTQANYYFLSGRAYSVLKDQVSALNSYEKGLEYKHDMNIDSIIKMVQQGFTQDPKNVSTEYVFADGFNNYGAFIHHYNNKKYFTKISRSTKGSKREELFYSDICQSFPILKDVVPKFIDSQFIDNILYLTIEFIEEASEKADDIIDIVKATQKISSVRYNDLIDKYPNPNYLFQMQNKPTSAAIFFTKIHKEEYNKNMFTLLYKLLYEKKYPDIVIRSIQKTEKLIMDNKLYTFINPEIHYSLIHRDFTYRNIKTQKYNNEIKAFDWAGFSIGPHFITVARYLTHSLFMYEDIKKMYLDNKNINGTLTRIEKIFFIYILILFYILRLKEKTTVEEFDKFITPALSDLEVLVNDFMKYDFIDEAKIVFEKLEFQIRQFTETDNKKTKTIRKLKKEVSHFKKENNNMINSKSWRLTRPFRVLRDKR